MKCPACAREHTGGGKFCRHCGTLISSTTSGPSTGLGAGFGRSAVGSRFGARPHRGTLILILGILGLVFCVLIGVAAWIMGRSDLAEMRSGAMDSAGEGMTRAGVVCGIIAVVITVGSLLVYLLMFGWFMTAA